MAYAAKWISGRRRRPHALSFGPQTSLVSDMVPAGGWRQRVEWTHRPHNIHCLKSAGSRAGILLTLAIVTVTAVPQWELHAPEEIHVPERQRQL